MAPPLTGAAKLDEVATRLMPKVISRARNIARIVDFSLVPVGADRAPAHALTFGNRVTCGPKSGRRRRAFRRCLRPVHRDDKRHCPNPIGCIQNGSWLTRSDIVHPVACSDEGLAVPLA